MSNALVLSIVAVRVCLATHSWDRVVLIVPEQSSKVGRMARDLKKRTA